ncbi:hypothetical protein CesoFtcFv8_026085 [Champsocephalus esox]|uniref:Uncharacterized protein n=1 Tax=Champsocephalus esox TaxID=159716 RepID=A0AAN8B1L9_9TELE|nr:hypothetical protein CesoFtcFv8_026085 [Champsocephalus esox]
MKRKRENNRRTKTALLAVVGRHSACESTVIAERRCMSGERQAANDRTTKRCFPSAAQRPSNPAGHITGCCTLL